MLLLSLSDLVNNMAADDMEMLISKVNSSHSIDFVLSEYSSLRTKIVNLWPLLLTWINFNPSMDK